ncbi:hypothetical protein A6U87_17620 [Rhizobium sp. AC44/96]|uniref:hypothetical protein n=1 Tax=Rhizobium sp. AC44/96 TaxID=1841654 RepID=UPI0008100D3F|nr:hypothetical protein [Rhizobium sp. AC44/96]OCJ03753.1 hypothetical protein A6U87_17620 [Rhizobium sp. AC44/96]
MSDRTDGLLSQHHLLLAIIHTDWATRLDHKVAAVIIERYFGRYGNSRASLRYLEEKTGATRPNIIASARRLVEHGAFSVVREGAGTRPTEYALNFGFVSSGIARDTATSGIVHDTSCGIADDTSGSFRGIAHDTKTSLTVTGLQAELPERDIDFAAPVAPPLSGLSADTAGTAKGGFEELWKAYGYRKAKAEAKAAYAKLSPDGDLHTRIVDAAGLWLSAWAAQGKADAPRFTLAKWLEREEFECDPPAGYKAKEKAGKQANAPAPTPEPTNDNQTEDEKEAPDFTVYPDQPALGVIERVEDYTYEDDGGKSLKIYYRTHDGKEIEQFLMYESPDQGEQERGQEDLRKVLEAVDLVETNDAQDLVGCKVDLMINGNSFVSCSRPWVPNTSGPRLTKRFKEVVDTTPIGGWCAKIGTAYEDEDEELDVA